MSRAPAYCCAVLCALAAPSSGSLRPGEGMWPFTSLPHELLAERHGFAPGDAWFERLRLSCVAFDGGGSGAFVSPAGLILTNQHVAMHALASTPAFDLYERGFVAAAAADELPCVGLRAQVLVEIEDVTERLAALATDGARREARRALTEAEDPRVARRIVDDPAAGTSARYTYRVYDDLRLVWCPEQALAFFGGQADNFSYPRYCVDAALLRAYEDGRPARSPAHLRLADRAPVAEELVLVAGHPARTERGRTLGQLEARRDHILPVVETALHRRLEALRAFSAESADAERRAHRRLFETENRLKAIRGELAALRDPRRLAAKARSEERLLRESTDAELAATVDELRAVYDGFARRWDEWFFADLPGRLGSLAMRVVQAAQCDEPNTWAINGLAEPTAFEPDLERAMLAAWFEAAADVLGPGHQLVEAMLDGESPQGRAAALVAGTDVGDAAYRVAAAGGETALDGDPLLAAARAISALRCETRAALEPAIDVGRRAADRIEAARAVDVGYPNSDGTLRLSFGVVRGYRSGDRAVPAKTTFGGLFARHDEFDGDGEHALPARVLAARRTIDPRTPLDLVCTADIGFGHSGSPAVDRGGRLLGVVFDGNDESIGNRLIYDEVRARAIAVTSTAIVAALRHVYRADRLLAELMP